MGASMMGKEVFFGKKNMSQHENFSLKYVFDLLIPGF